MYHSVWCKGEHWVWSQSLNLFIILKSDHLNLYRSYWPGWHLSFLFHCMKNNIFEKTLNVNIIFSGFSGNDGNIIFSVKRKSKKKSYFPEFPTAWKKEFSSYENLWKGHKIWFFRQLSHVSVSQKYIFWTFRQTKM